MNPASSLGSNRVRLRTELAAHYQGLAKSLTRRLGSSDFAHEALHEAYVRLDRVTDAVPIRSPTDFIFRTAINIAKDKQRALNRRLKATDVDALLDLCDEQPGPARIVEARLEVEAVRKALDKLPERPRDVFRSISIDGHSPQQVATRLNISLRTVENDFRLALTHCAECLDRPLQRRVGGPRPWR